MSRHSRESGNPRVVGPLIVSTNHLCDTSPLNWNFHYKAIQHIIAMHYNTEIIYKCVYPTI